MGSGESVDNEIKFSVDKLRRQRLILYTSMQATAAVLGLVAVSVTIYLDDYVFARPAMVGVIAGVGIALMMFAMAATAAKSSIRSRRVFVSFAESDREFAEELIRKLRDRGVYVLKADEVIRVGDNIADRLKELVRQSSHVVVIGSPDYRKSRWAALELAMVGKHMKILPVLYKSDDLLPDLMQIQHIRADEVTNELVDALLASLPRVEDTKISAT